MFYNKSIEDVSEELNTSPDGLTTEEVLDRQNKYGKNILPKKKKDTIFKIFLSEFKSPIEILLLVTIVISFFIGEKVDAFAILFIVLVDVILGTFEEYKANNTAESLSKLVTSVSKVIRNGKITSVEASEITKGDIVYLESGDKIPADIRIVESHNLMVDESILTGESMATSKNNETISKDNVSLTEQKNMQ